MMPPDELRALANTARHLREQVNKMHQMRCDLQRIAADLTGWTQGYRPVNTVRVVGPNGVTFRPSPEAEAWDAAKQVFDQRRRERWEEAAAEYHPLAEELRAAREPLARACARV